MPTSSQQLDGALAGRRAAMPLWSSSASLIWRPIVSTGFSEVIGSWKIMAMSLPRTFRMLVFFELEQVAAVEDDLARDDPARRLRDQAA